MEEYFGIKELYDVSLRCTYPIEINGKTYLENESIIKFDKIQLAPITEGKIRVYASGGYGNSRLVDWEDTKEINFILSEGVISKIGLALLSNSKLTRKEKGEVLNISFNEKLETDEFGKAKTKYFPIKNNTFFIYDAINGEKINEYAIEDNTIITDFPFKEIIVDYTFEYTEEGEVLFIGKRLINGYLKLDGKMRWKDDSDGHIKTGIIEIPRVKLMSDLSMRLGKDASPYVYKFQLAGFPIGARGNQYVCKIIILNNEIDSDL